MNRQREEQTWLITGSLVVLAVIGVGFCLAHTRAVLIPFVLAIFITSIMSPLVDFQVLKLRFSRTVAVMITLLVVILVFVAFGLLVVQCVQSVLRSVDEYTEDFSDLGRSALLKLEEFHITVSAEDMVQNVKAEVPRWATSTLGNIAGFLSQGLLVFIFVGFLLAGRNPHVIRTGVYAEIDTQIRRYLGTKLLISAVTGILVGVCLHLFDLRLASVFGLLTFMLNFIPSVGSIVATLLPLPTAVAQYQENYLMVFAVVAIPGTIQIVIGNVIDPKLMGGGLKLHPVTILLSLAVWGLLWGPVGMILAVPMTATIRIVLDQFEITRPASEVLAGQLPGFESRRLEKHDF